MSSTTSSNSVKTNSIDTIGGVAMTIGDASATSILLGSSTAGRTPTITIDTLSTANTNASPAIAIGTSSSLKTIKLGISTSSVHCSSLDIKGSAMNNISNATGAVSIGDAQTDGILNLGAGALRTSTGVINIGNTSSLNAINIETGSTLNSSTTPAISIGTANTVKTIKIGSPSVNNTVFLTNLEIIKSAGGMEVNSGNDNAFYFNKQTSGTLNFASGTAVRSGAINIACQSTSSCPINIANNAGTTLTATSGSVNIANGTGGAGTLYTTTVGISSGTTTGAVTIGNKVNTTNMLSGTINVATGVGTSLIPLVGSVNIATATGTNVSIPVNIASGVTTGLTTIGNVDNITTISSGTLNVTGNLTIGTGKNITLPPTTGIVAPTAFTQLGGTSTNTSTSLPVLVGSVNIMIPVQITKAGTYLFTCGATVQHTASVLTNFYSNIFESSASQTVGTAPTAGTGIGNIVPANFGQQTIGLIGANRFSSLGGSYVYTVPEAKANFYYSLTLSLLASGTFSNFNCYMTITRIA